MIASIVRFDALIQDVFWLKRDHRPGSAQSATATRTDGAAFCQPALFDFGFQTFEHLLALRCVTGGSGADDDPILEFGLRFFVFGSNFVEFIKVHD